MGKQYKVLLGRRIISLSKSTARPSPAAQMPSSGALKKREGWEKPLCAAFYFSTVA